VIDDVLHLPASLATTPRTDPLPRAWRLRTADRLLEALWSSGAATRPPLDANAFIAAVAGAAELPDPSGWRRRLAILCGELEQHAQLTALGRTLAYGQLTAALRDRVRLERLWARHPTVLDQPLAAPIVIVGQMRSGSTRLQRLLACDPRLAATHFYESWNPVPRGGDRGGFDDRAWRARIGLALSRALNPAFGSIHPTSARAADEQIGWHGISIFGAAFETQWRVPNFTAAVEAADTVPVYREFRRLLQTVTWLRGDDGTRRCVLKVPQFAQDLDAILTVFPDATLLRLDRDPADVVASSASLVRNQMQVQSEAVCPAWVGRETLRKVALRERRTGQTLQHADVPVHRIEYAAIGADWEGEMARLYRFLRLPFTPRTRKAMAAMIARSKRHRLERHRYALADYGLTAADVRSAVAEPEPTQIAAE
jgi:hypothetical protein